MRDALVCKCNAAGLRRRGARGAETEPMPDRERAHPVQLHAIQRKRCVDWVCRRSYSHVQQVIPLNQKLRFLRTCTRLQGPVHTSWRYTRRFAHGIHCVHLLYSVYVYCVHLMSQCILSLLLIPHVTYNSLQFYI